MLEVVSSSDVSAVKSNEDLSQIADWCNKWIVEMNSSKTKSIVFSAKRDKPFHSPLFLNNTAIEDVDHHAHLGLILTNNLSWKSQITEMHQKAAKRLNIHNVFYVLKAIKFKIKRGTLISLYKSLIRPVMEYCNIILDNCHESES